MSSELSEKLNASPYKNNPKSWILVLGMESEVQPRGLGLPRAPPALHSYLPFDTPTWFCHSHSAPANSLPGRFLPFYTNLPNFTRAHTMQPTHPSYTLYVTVHCG